MQAFLTIASDSAASTDTATAAPQDGAALGKGTLADAAAFAELAAAPASILTEMAATIVPGAQTAGTPTAPAIDADGMTDRMLAVVPDLARPALPARVAAPQVPTLPDTVSTPITAATKQSETWPLVTLPVANVAAGSASTGVPTAHDNESLAHDAKRAAPATGSSIPRLEVGQHTLDPSPRPHDPATPNTAGVRLAPGAQPVMSAEPASAVPGQLHAALPAHQGGGHPHLPSEPASATQSHLVAQAPTMQTSAITGAATGPGQPASMQTLSSAPAAQVAEAVRIRAGEQTITVRLDPPDLGTVRIDFAFDRGAVTAVVAADQPATGDLLRRHADWLQQALADAGLEGAAIDWSDERPETGEAPWATLAREASAPRDDTQADDLVRTLPEHSGIYLRL